MDSRPTQRQIYGLLQEIFYSRVEWEWNIRAGATDAFNEPGTYAPRLDIAVGPFNSTASGVCEDIGAIRSASQHPLLEKIEERGRRQHLEGFCKNPNPRCLLAIEVEFSGSSKHILGDFTNAGMMGLVGVVIGSPGNFDRVQRVGEYARRLRSLGKAPQGMFTNTACFEAREFVGLLKKLRAKAIHPKKHPESSVL